MTNDKRQMQIIHLVGMKRDRHAKRQGELSDKAGIEQDNSLLRRKARKCEILQEIHIEKDKVRSHIL